MSALDTLPIILQLRQIIIPSSQHNPNSVLIFPQYIQDNDDAKVAKNNLQLLEQKIKNYALHRIHLSLQFQSYQYRFVHRVCNKFRGTLFDR